MAVYKVRLLNGDHSLDHTLLVPDDQYILDIAEAEGIRLPAGCLQGECSACLAKVIEGKVNQEEQRFLQPAEIAAGYAVTCVSYPRSDCTLETHQESVLYQDALYFSQKSSSHQPD